MSSTLIWLMVPLAPLLFLLMLLRFPAAINRITPWIWIGFIPAFYCSLLPPAVFSPDILWRGASFGSSNMLVTTWLGLTSVLWAVAGAYAAFSMRDSQHLLRFWTFWLLSLSGNLLLVIAQDALSFYVGFSMMSLAAYGLVIHNGRPAARRAGRLYLQLAILGEVLLLSGLLMRAHAAQGSFQFAEWSSVAVDPLTAVLVLTGLGLKAGFWPLHVWLPLAHPAAPAPASAVLSGAMLKAGIFGIWLFLPASPAADVAGWSLRDWSVPVMWMGIFSALFGVVFGLLRSDAKEALAYSSVSQMGYLLFIVALAWQLPDQRDMLLIVLLVYAVHHGFTKAALFLSADVIKSGHAVNRAQTLVLVLGVLIPSLALCGLIFTSGAAAKTGIKNVIDSTALDYWLPWLQVSAVATTLLLSRVCFLLLTLQKHAVNQPLSLRLLAIWGGLSMVPVLLPWFWAPMRESLQTTLVLYKLVDLSWPILLALALVLLVIWQKWKVPAALARIKNPFLILSLRLTRRSNKVLLPAFDVTFDTRRWRSLERRWNRYWQASTVNLSAVSLLVFLVVAAAFLLVS